MQKDYRQIQTELARPFAPEDLEWRIQVTTQDKSKGLAVPYVTNRAIQDRLDDVVGPENWRNDYKPWHSANKKEAQLCGISVYLEDRKEWLTKWNGAEDTDVEPVKGGLSDSMKRAAVQFGIGRVLYKMNPVWVFIEQKGKSFIIKDSERPKLDKAYMDMLERLGLKPAQPGGLQSQLTPKADKTAPQDNPAPEVKPQQQPQRQQQQTQPTARQTPPPAQQTPSAESGKVTNFPVRPQWQYKIVTATIQPGMTQECMSLEIVNAEGKKMRAFYPTVTEELAQGTELSDVTLVLKKQGTVAFYMLKSYRIAAPAEQAA